MIKKLLIYCSFMCISFHVTNAQSINNINEINLIWEKFYQAFDSLDYTLMAEIHTKDLIRVSGGKKISDYDTYIKGYKQGFEKDKQNNRTKNISLRFFERINNDSIASERGIYKLIINQDKNDEQAYYGQFHVLLKKVDKDWKIFFDYDSNEENKIGEKDFLESFEIDDFKNFIYKKK